MSKKVSDGKVYLYAARDTTTGKLVSNLTNPRRKYWDRECNALSAINYYNRSKGRGLPNFGHIELVKFELVEVTDKTVE